MLRTVIDMFWHPDCLEHDTGTGLWELPGRWDWLDEPEAHPENAARLRTFRHALAHGPVAPSLRWHEGRHAREEELARVHTPAYLAELRAACTRGGLVAIEENTVVGPGSWPAVLAAAGTAVAATEAVLSGAAHTAYALVRPPGHHAQPTQADGYCLVNNVAVAAAHALASGLDRVAVLDWDVHHGNGTQEVFLADERVLTVSVHMRHGRWGRAHPQTGAPEETGRSGHNVNIELSLGAGDAAYRRALEEVAEPVLREFRPQLLLGASGFDGSTFDPNGRYNLTAAGYRWIGGRVAALAGELTGRGPVLTQEGGYLRGYAALCLHALVEGLLGHTEPLLADPLAYLPDDSARNPDRTTADLDAVRSVLREFWAL
ncbi:acetoin utilization deacetylase AcuC-like enzyme [Crossiella equi]|uniref:Acetoin utilization deacetylase AcuC-like enzyme n=1 Tax=Crossiella equi TaxID=130796 RepID=A0ABS5AI41_9PSEU|nr:histone deacetylase [Crossiella equi]MBP2476254.1 acetoin utilization deacetylase AcuC-like enzyme [Crossiella equi]